MAPVLDRGSPTIASYRLIDARGWRAQARLTGSVLSLAAGLGFLLTPPLAALADAVGRKPLLLLGAATSCLKYGLVALRPGVPAVVLGAQVSRCASSSAGRGVHRAVQAPVLGRPTDVGRD